MRIGLLSTILLLATAATGQAQRLPTTVTPVHYDMTVTPRLAEASFGGRVAIRVRLASPSSTIVLNAAEIKFGAVTVAAGGKSQKARRVTVPLRSRLHIVNQYM